MKLETKACSVPLQPLGPPARRSWNWFPACCWHPRCANAATYVRGKRPHQEILIRKHIYIYRYAYTSRTKSTTDVNHYVRTHETIFWGLAQNPARAQFRLPESENPAIWTIDLDYVCRNKKTLLISHRSRSCNQPSLGFARPWLLRNRRCDLGAVSWRAEMEQLGALRVVTGAVCRYLCRFWPFRVPDPNIKFKMKVS